MYPFDFVLFSLTLYKPHKWGGHILFILGVVIVDIILTMVRDFFRDFVWILLSFMLVHFEYGIHSL